LRARTEPLKTERARASRVPLPFRCLCRAASAAIVSPERVLYDKPMAEQAVGRRTALVLSGAVAKGAFEAGVLSVLSRERLRFPIERMVGARNEDFDTPDAWRRDCRQH